MLLSPFLITNSCKINRNIKHTIFHRSWCFRRCLDCRSQPVSRLYILSFLCFTSRLIIIWHWILLVSLFSLFRFFISFVPAISSNISPQMGRILDSSVWLANLEESVSWQAFFFVFFLMIFFPFSLFFWISSAFDSNDDLWVIDNNLDQFSKWDVTSKYSVILLLQIFIRFLSFRLQRWNGIPKLTDSSISSSFHSLLFSWYSTQWSIQYKWRLSTRNSIGWTE